MTTAILCIVWVLWPLLAFAGGLGFSPLAAIVAVATLPAAIPNVRMRPYMAVFAAFFVFAAVSALWSPLGAPIADIDFGKLRFNIKSDVLRVGLLFLAFGIVMAAAMKLDDRGRRIAGAVATCALLVQLVIVVLLSFFEKQALEMFAGFMPASDEGVQNISRNAQIMAVAAPGLAITLADSRWRMAGIAAGGAVLAATVAALAVREVFAGLLALAVAAAAIGIVMVFRRSGFRIIAALVAAIILAAPLIFGFLSRGANASLAADTISYRAAIWRRVCEVIAEHPIWGSGVGVLRTIRERIPEGEFKGLFLIPNHAHNMTLQLWAETGVIGAGLLAAAILLAGWRMPAPEKLGRTGWMAAALAAALFANACVSFDLWNAGWWGMAGFLAVLIVAQPRSTTPAGTAAQ